MSLISDPDFLIHNLRLAYLRNVDDPYGPRLVSLNPSYSSNPYILAASLADIERWPELGMPSSPQLSDDEADPASRSAKSSGFPGATGLKYTQTIMGPSRSGGAGIRVSGSRRHSSSKRESKTPRQPTAVNDTVAAPGASPGAPAPAPLEEIEAAAENWSKELEKHEPSSFKPSSPLSDRESIVPPKEVVFVPQFKGAAEMEARRKVRMLARRAPMASESRPSPPPTVNPEISSSSSSENEEDDILGDNDEEDDFDDMPDANDSMDDDEFDPEFAATRPQGGTSDSASDIFSVFSAANSTSNSSALASSPHVAKDSRSRPKLSPVTETKSNLPSPKRSADRSLDISFEMVTPPPRPEAVTPAAPRRKIEQQLSSSKSSRPLLSAHSSTVSTSDSLFTRRKVPPARPLQSALSAMLASSGGSSNPFRELYAAISGRAETASTVVQVYFPHAREPAGRSMELNVRKDATMEEMVGFALWSYWEEGWKPSLDEGLGGEDDPRRAVKLSAVGWIMRIAEEDGEVDEDFPPPDRTGKISKFNFDAYAVLEASPAQVQQNQILEAKIQRRPSRIMVANKKSDTLMTSGGPGAGGLVPSLSTGPGTSALFGFDSWLSPVIYVARTVLKPRAPNIPPDTCRGYGGCSPHLNDNPSNRTAGMYMQESLELVCRKRRLMNPGDYALLLGDKSILIPLDRTVASLQGQRDLILVKRSMLPHLGVDVVKTAGRTTDPNASIFKRISDVPTTQFSSATDYTAAYKKYTVYRKMPMMVTRHQRTLAIDGVYIHIMPSTNRAKAVWDSGKTSSYHLKSVVTCQQSGKSSSTFKLVVQHDGGNKRYDFEAESSKLANEIVQTVRGVKAALERAGTVNKARRSRHVG